MNIAVVGAGGKTTICERIANGLAEKLYRALLTTTTKICHPISGSVYVGSANNITPDGYLTAAARKLLADGKLEGFSPAEIAQIAKKRLFDHIVIEADGANRRPVKCPNDTEPVYPLHTDLIIGVIGLDCLGKPVSDEFVHRKELFAAVTQTHIGNTITASHIRRLIHHPNGLFRHAHASVKKIVFLNKYDTINETQQHEVQSIIEECLLPVIVTSRDTDWVTGFFDRYIGKDNNES
jgi:probable selenium-dependent hydroxylase accessory protein YqeC